MTKIFRALGAMSGTSVDGVDIAIIETDGITTKSLHPSITFSYPHAFQEKIKALFHKGSADRATDIKEFKVKKMAKEIANAHTEAINAYLNKYEIDKSTIDVVGIHGQTIGHDPDNGYTCQICDGQEVANQTDIPVINDFRIDDVNAGGQGAPLVPIYHRAMLRSLNQPFPIAVVNIGGVANITWIGENEHDLLGFDTGPGNAPIDDWMLLKVGRSFDMDGKFAAKGAINETILHQMLDHPYFNQTPPKSLDRQDFTFHPVQDLSTEDGAATLTALTAQTIAQSIQHLPAAPKKWIITGGGRHNKTLMKMLAEKINAPVETTEDINLDGDGIEAQAFAFFAVRKLLNLPITFPGTTGRKQGDVVCGTSYQPQKQQETA